jgi:uncharacterized protein (TIGR02646 family)
MIYIDISQLEPSQEWLDKSKKLLDELISHRDDKAKRDEIIDRASSQKQWKNLKIELKRLSFGKCWYSEAREVYSHYHVDHFRPKKKVIDDTNEQKAERDGYWWLTFDHTNYRLSGGVGNTTKREHFAVRANCATCPDHDCEDEITFLLDPTKRDDPKKLMINENGEMVPINGNVEHWDHIRANYTINKLDLNYPDLVDARHIKWMKCSILIKKVDLLNDDYQADPTAKKESKLEMMMEEVRKLIAPCEELSSTVRACLRASRRDWALLILEENIDLRAACAEYMFQDENDEEADTN